MSSGAWKTFMLAGGILVALPVRGDQTNLAAGIRPAGVDEMGYPTNAAAAFARGQAEARRDLTNAVFTLKTAGLPGPTRHYYEGRLLDRCGVKLEPLAGCLVTEGLMKYMAGYNEIARQRLEQKFGTNIFSELEAEAAESYQKATSRQSPAGTYMIRAGDTLSKIAQTHGVTVKALAAANPGVDPAKLKVGRMLQIPARQLPPK
jgi:LysM repeat protein